VDPANENYYIKYIKRFLFARVPALLDVETVAPPERNLVLRKILDVFRVLAKTSKNARMGFQ
jgi:hypothetical protein